MKQSKALAPLLICAALLATTDGRAQVGSFYHGWYIAATFKSPGWPYGNGDGGLFFVHPRQPGPPTPIGPLPKSLTGKNQTTGPWGAWSVFRSPSWML